MGVRRVNSKRRLFITTPPSPSQTSLPSFLSTSNQQPSLILFTITSTSTSSLSDRTTSSRIIVRFAGYLFGDKNSKKRFRFLATTTTLPGNPGLVPLIRSKNVGRSYRPS
ncbi:hypothetical protein TWF106_010615 [Orbilia oligospora]|uniref:Uncharacterized protein n=1 Tax=Orbilia oligospora TaxID=2813651 RepID=A0A6G1MEY9_ORBOL|nr:hypothetical protein TWF788_000250 [Orbilia oligospora]KAF3200959.1 hypothetical protein TWF679_000584 [Orbilia oligospora]KAF3227127.1 hypothetical protein TWF106_010615 [Orbilia oligospora]KAF3232069.1 hypothetical protein TWF191_004045 [Orbilia oligospora]KAF3256399.1 hypothetical protein TWF192_001824 [Orbilia oligospora]